METEQTAYEVPGSQLRWRASQLNAQGYPFQVQPAGGGVYIVIVQAPASVNPFAYQPPPRQAWPAWDSANVLRWLLALAVVAAAGWIAWSLFAGGDASAPPPAPPQTDNVWGWFDSLRLPWEDAAAAPAAQPVQAEPFRWPWESAADGLAAAESVQGTVTTVSTAILGVLVLLIILALVRRGGRR